MSVMRPDKTKIVLPRCGADEFWQLVSDHYAGDDARKWKYLAMLALRENAGWPLDYIGGVFAHSKGHILRCLKRVKRELRLRFAASPEFLGYDDPEDEPNAQRIEDRTVSGRSAHWPIERPQ
ncbi:MAG: hypothetical protein KY476_10315 [Planctomycetes bacterium]|nr:hypothetical protein [Planctomycetota bacterium]